MHCSETPSKAKVVIFAKLSVVDLLRYLFFISFTYFAVTNVVTAVHLGQQFAAESAEGVFKVPLQIRTYL